jgi:hypothetical protein
VQSKRKLSDADASTLNDVQREIAECDAELTR